MSQNRFDDAALIVVDVQNDFCPGGALGVEGGDRIVPVINRLMPHFRHVIAGRDWHPPDHISFREQGGPWPPHCVRNTPGADFHPDLNTEPITGYYIKAFTSERDAYSEFEAVDERGRTFDEGLREIGARRLYITGLATDYCVRATALDALEKGYEVYVITDAVAAVDVNPGDGDRALEEMRQRGAKLIESRTIAAAA